MDFSTLWVEQCDANGAETILEIGYAKKLLLEGGFQ